MGLQPEDWFGNWPGGFFELGIYDDDLADIYSSWYDFAAGHYIGSTLVAPYIQPLYGIFSDIHDIHREIGLYATRTVQYIEALDDGWMIENLNWWYFPNVYYLQDDPGTLFDSILGDLWTEWEPLRTAPSATVSGWLDEQGSWFSAFLGDPLAQVTDWFDTVWPDFYWFRQDPAYLIQFWLAQSDPFYEGLDVDPQSWLEAKIDARLPEVPEPQPEPEVIGLDVLLKMFDVPSSWLLERIYALTERWLRWMIEGVF